MKLSTTQQNWADAFELSESLIEDAAEANSLENEGPFSGLVCPDCWRHQCVCATDSMAEQVNNTEQSPEEKNAKTLKKMKDDAAEAVADDLRKKHNTKPDVISFYPSTERA
jgi:hypothetical protein